MGIGGRQHENHMPRRLFQRFEHGIEGVVAQHVNFVDHIHLPAPHTWRVNRVFQQLGHLFNAAMAGGIQLQVIDITTFVDLQTGPALTAGIRIIAIAFLAVQGLRKDSSNRCFANPAGACEQVRMVNPAGFQSVTKRAHHMILSDQRRKLPRPPFAGQHLMLRDWVVGKQ